jgi:hypothetical protein
MINESWFNAKETWADSSHPKQTWLTIQAALSDPENSAYAQTRLEADTWRANLPTSGWNIVVYII